MPNETEAEKKRAYHREYYRKHKAKFRKKAKCRICGKLVGYDHRARHKKSTYHQKRLQQTLAYIKANEKTV